MWNRMCHIAWYGGDRTSEFTMGDDVTRWELSSMRRQIFSIVSSIFERWESTNRCEMFK